MNSFTAALVFFLIALAFPVGHLVLAQDRVGPPKPPVVGDAPRVAPRADSRPEGPGRPPTGREAGATVAVYSEEPILASTSFDWTSDGVAIYHTFYQIRNEKDQEYERRIVSFIKKLKRAFPADVKE